MGLSLYVAVLTLCGSACAVNITINQYAGPDGEAYYYTPVYCISSGSLLQSAYYASLRSSYTTRYSIDCCYRADSRNLCCVQVDSKGNQTCRCSTSVLCGLEPRIQTTTAEPTTESTTTTTTTTTPEPTTTTTTTTTTTPTTTVTTAPTTTVPPSLCQTSYRILNGVPVSNDCSFESIANITTKNGAVVSCTAVLATATVNGILRRTFVTSTICTNFIGAGTVPFDLSIGNKIFPIMAPIFTLVNGTNGISYITIADRYLSLVSYLGSCPTTTCAFNPVTMAGKLDFNDCKIVSWGSSTSGSLKGTGLNEAAVRFSPTGCTTLSNLFNVSTSLCFSTISGKNLYCSGDNGAPVYCKAPSNGEWILLGVAAMQLTCNGSNEVKVIPFPG